jgi:aminoglycoside phosphotransferase (APT) family kinase protein
VTFEDDRGWSAVPLLARADARVLFLVSAHTAFAVRNRPGSGRSNRVSLESLGHLPFTEKSFDCVVLNSNLVRPLVRVHSCARILQEIHRVLKPDGGCIVATRQRRLPRSLQEAWSCSLGRPDRVWSAALQRARFKTSTVAGVRMSAGRVSEIGLPSIHNGSKAPDFAGHRLMVARKSAAVDDASIVERILKGAGQQVLNDPKAGLAVERFLVRKIGKTTVIAVAPRGSRYVIRIPRSAVATERAERNWAALEHLQRSSYLPDPLQVLLPRPLCRGCIQQYGYTVEDARPGLSGEDYTHLSNTAQWEPQALEFITQLHLASRHVAVFDRTKHQRHVAAPLARIREGLPTRGPVGATLDRLEASLQEGFDGTAMPFVSAHGDFSDGNCLYRDGRLSGVVDWELFSGEALPAVDLLQRMTIPGESNRHQTWQRFSQILQMTRPGAARRLPAFGAYLDRMEIPDRALPSLLLMHWVQHVADRIDARGSDTEWMRKRVLHPLAELQVWLA